MKNLLSSYKYETIIPTANVYSSPEVLDEMFKNIIPLYSLVMSNHHSLVELLSSNRDNKRKDEFQIKTKIYPHLRHLQKTNKIMQFSMKFPDTPGSFTTVFSYKKLPMMLDVNLFVNTFMNF